MRCGRGCPAWASSWLEVAEGDVPSAGPSVLRASHDCASCEGESMAEGGALQ